MGDQTYTFDVHRLGFENVPKTAINLASLQKPLKKLYIAYQKALSTNLPLSKVRLNANRRGLSIDSILNTSEEQNTFMNEALITDNQVSFRGAVVFTIQPPEKKNSKYKAAFTNLDEEIKMKNIKEHNSLFVSLDEKEKFLISKEHPSLFVCVNKTRTSKNFEMRVFVCYSAEQALDLMKALKGEAVHEYAKKPYNQSETASRENSLAGKSSTDSISNNDSELSTPVVQQSSENQVTDDVYQNSSNEQQPQNIYQQRQNNYQPEPQNYYQQPHHNYQQQSQNNYLQQQNVYPQQQNVHQQQQNVHQQQQNVHQQQQNVYQHQQPQQNAYQQPSQNAYQQPLYSAYEQNPQYNNQLPQYTIPNYSSNAPPQGGEVLYPPPNYGFSVFQDPQYKQGNNEVLDVTNMKLPRINPNDMKANDPSKVLPKTQAESNLYTVPNKVSAQNECQMRIKEQKEGEKVKLSKMETQMPYSSTKNEEEEENNDDEKVISNMAKQSIYPFSPVVKEFTSGQQPYQLPEPHTKLYPQLSDLNSPLLSPNNTQKPTTPSPRNSQIENQKMPQPSAPPSEKVVPKKIPPAVPTKKPALLPPPTSFQKPPSQSSDEGIVSPPGIVNGKESLHLIKPKKFRGISVLPFPVNLQKPGAPKEVKEDLAQNVQGLKLGNTEKNDAITGVEKDIGYIP